MLQKFVQNFLQEAGAFGITQKSNRKSHAQN